MKVAASIILGVLIAAAASCGESKTSLKSHADESRTALEEAQKLIP